MNLHPENLSLDCEERERSQILTDIISEKISQSSQQAISFAEYMDLALYEPSYGYYSSGVRTIGRAGDFITAPEMGSVFGNCLAIKIADILANSDCDPQLVEFGAGSGNLAVQILTELQKRRIFISEYSIIEVSPVLRNVQKENLLSADVIDSTKFRWYNRLPATGLNGVIIANELLDAMPVELFRRESEEFKQAYVVQNENSFELAFLSDKSSDFEACLPSFELQHWGQSAYTSEVHCQALAWLRTVGASLNKGAILIVDYGFPEYEYYHPDRNNGTLMCHRRHHVHGDPFAFVGCQDITAHVNFSALARIADQLNLRVNGYTSLGSFVVDTGVSDLDLLAMPDVEQLKLTRELLMLTDPSEMGELFKILEITKNISTSDVGFRQFNYVHKL